MCCFIFDLIILALRDKMADSHGTKRSAEDDAKDKDKESDDRRVKARLETDAKKEEPVPRIINPLTFIELWCFISSEYYGLKSKISFFASDCTVSP